MSPRGKKKSPSGLRIIKTARDEASINKAAAKGFRPLVKEVIPSPEIHSKYMVIQHIESGIIQVIGDYRAGFWGDEGKDFKIVIPWTEYYPHRFKSPFAAYLIPSDIQVGERVFVEDLIEDYVGAIWNQGDTYRLDSCEAVWNGTDLEIKYEEGIGPIMYLG